MNKLVIILVYCQNFFNLCRIKVVTVLVVCAGSSYNINMERVVVIRRMKLVCSRIFSLGLGYVGVFAIRKVVLNHARDLLYRSY